MQSKGYQIKSYQTHPLILSTRSLFEPFLWTLREFVLGRLIELVSTTVYGISRSWASVMPVVSTKSNCKCFANSLDQILERLSEGDLKILLCRISSLSIHYCKRGISLEQYWGFVFALVRGWLIRGTLWQLSEKCFAKPEKFFKNIFPGQESNKNFFTKKIEKLKKNLRN